MTLSGLWVMAAKYQLEEENDMTAARALLQRAIRINNQCKELWLEVHGMKYCVYYFTYCGSTLEWNFFM